MLHVRELIEEFVRSLRAGRPVVYTGLVETRGSTPQKAGAVMLVYGDGSQQGTLGGGCVEAEVKRQALGLLTHDRSQIVSFQLDHDYGWDDGLICGGRMTMLIDPARRPASREYYEALWDCLQQGNGGTEAVVFDRAQATEPDVPRCLFGPGGEVLAQVGTLAISREVLCPLSIRPRPYVEGGVSFLPHLPRCRLIIVGAGHVGQKVAELASQVDFDVTVVDDRHDYCCPERLPGADRCLVGPIESMLDDLPIDEHTFCLIVTRGHHHDEQALFRLIGRGAAYVGMIGSRRKIRLIFEDLRREGVSDHLLDQVHAPVGLPIGSQSVPEIAISIVAELVQVRNSPEGSGIRPSGGSR